MMKYKELLGIFMGISIIQIWQDGDSGTVGIKKICGRLGLCVVQHNGILHNG